MAQNDWLVSRPGKTITIHDLASIVTPAYNASHTARNIIAGFERPGIFPFSRNAFTDEDFECAEVTNRPLPSTSSTSGVVESSNIPQHSHVEEMSPSLHVSTTARDALPASVKDEDMTDCDDSEPIQNVQLQSQDLPAPPAPGISPPAVSGSPDITNNTRPVPSLDDPEAIALTSALVVAPIVPTSSFVEAPITTSAVSVPVKAPVSTPKTATGSVIVITPEIIRPFPKASPRKEGKGRKKGRSRILTDTSEKGAVRKAEQSAKKKSRLQTCCSINCWS